MKTSTEKQHDLYQRVIKQNEYENIIKLHFEYLWKMKLQQNDDIEFQRQVSVNGQLQEVTKMTPVRL